MGFTGSSAACVARDEVCMVACWVHGDAVLRAHLVARSDTACTRPRAIKRARRVAVFSRNADLQLKAAKLYAEHGAAVLPHLPQIGNDKGSEKE